MKTYIDFKPAMCRDCYRCLKSCPVKAIRLLDHQARIITERCIQCGRCIIACPQNAKTVHSDVAEVAALLASSRTVVASVAPSFVSSFGLQDFGPMRQALSELGFADCEETAVGAAAVTAEYARLMRSGEYPFLISSACPSVNRLIQFYYPQALPYLAPVDSPMLAHAKMLKSRFPDAAVVFIGPCISKKREADESGLIDNVLTFEDLSGMLASAGIHFAPPVTPDAAAVSGASARCYPIGGGIIKSFQTLPEGYDYIAIDRLDKCKDVLSNLEHFSKLFIEMNSCEFGCVNGPCSLLGDSHAISAEVKVRKYASTCAAEDVKTGELELRKSFSRIRDDAITPSEDQIRNILARTGKFKPEDELNCGACGYTSCREKAWAVANGFADDSLCIPYMRSKAESVSSEVIRRMPYGIVVLNSGFNIESINRAAISILGIDAFHPEGQQLFDFVSIPDFVIAQSNDSNIIGKQMEIAKTGKVVELSIILLKEHSHLLGIFKDVTEQSNFNEKLRSVRQQTYQITDEVVRKQMRIAQEIASLLGETTAETKIALLKLKEAMQKED